MGDFNVPGINWATRTGLLTFSDEFCDLIFHYNLSQLVDQPTHICGNILDLIITNCESAISNLTVYTTNSFSMSSNYLFCYSSKTIQKSMRYYSKVESIHLYL